jgi:hypothetical protein
VEDSNTKAENNSDNNGGIKMDKEKMIKDVERYARMVARAETEHCTEVFMNQLDGYIQAVKTIYGEETAKEIKKHYTNKLMKLAGI